MISSDPRMTGDDFVEVYDEPFHRPRFRNDHVYVYDVRIPPAGVSFYHRHAQDTFYTGITGGRSTNQVQHEDKVVHEGGPGFSACLCHRDKPFIHQVGNEGTADIRLIGAEALARPQIVSASPLSHAGHQLIWETERVRGYKLTLEPGESLGDVDYRFSGLLVFLSSGCFATTGAQGTESISWRSPGDWLWCDGPRRWSLRNPGSSRIEAVLGEWK